MTNIIIPEELKEVLEEIVSYEEIDKLTEEEFEWAQEWLYVNLPPHEPFVEDSEKEESWKIEIDI